MVGWAGLGPAQPPFSLRDDTRAAPVAPRRSMRLSIKYGDGALELTLPRSRFQAAWSIAGRAQGGPADLRGIGAPDADPWRAALDRLADRGFAEAARGSRVGLLLADGTRDWSPEALLPPLAALLGGAASIGAFLCTGTHAADSPANRALARRVRDVLAAAGLEASVVVNDARGGRFRRVGRTSRGTPVELNEESFERDVLLTISDVKHHYFAGYSNPTKYLVPGLASLETTRANHALALDERSRAGRHPWHPAGARRENPLAEDLAEAFELGVAGRPHFALTTASSGKRVLWASGGRTEEATRDAILHVDRLAEIAVEPARYLVVSPGGEPNDESLYTAQRALELSASASRPDGEVLFLARCRSGIGPPGARENFFEPLRAPLAEVAAGLGGPYRVYAHKPVKLARYVQARSRVWMHSELSDADVASIHLHPAADPQAVLDRWVAQAGEGDRVAFVDDASKLLLVEEPSPQVPIE